MNYDFAQDFLTELGDIPELPSDSRGEWYHSVRSHWISGVFHHDRQDPNATVELARAANNEVGFDETLVDYWVYVRLTDDHLEMPPETAISLGHLLIEAGTTALRDKARHAWFLAGAASPGGAR